MIAAEAIALFNKHAAVNMIVENKRSKIQYQLNRDCVYDETTELVYGFYVNPHPRVKVLYKWFELKNVRFIRMCTPAGESL